MDEKFFKAIEGFIQQASDVVDNIDKGMTIVDERTREVAKRLRDVERRGRKLLERWR